MPPPKPRRSLHQAGRCTRLAADMLAPDLSPLDDHDAAAPPLLVPPLAAPAAVPAPVAHLERAPGQGALGQQRARRRVRGVPLEARRQGVRDGLAREVPARPALGRRAAPLLLVLGRVLLPVVLLRRRFRRLGRRALGRRRLGGGVGAVDHVRPRVLARQRVGDLVTHYAWGRERTASCACVSVDFLEGGML